MPDNSDAPEDRTAPLRISGNSDSPQSTVDPLRIAQSLLTIGMEFAETAYESGLKDIETLLHGTSYAKRVRNRARSIISDQSLTLELVVSMLQYSMNPNTDTRTKINKVTAEIWRHRDNRAISKKEKFATALRLLLRNGDQLCDYCWGIRETLLIMGKYCSEKCHKGYLNRQDFQRRQRA